MTTSLLIALVIVGLLALHDEIRSRHPARTAAPARPHDSGPVILTLAAWDGDMRPGERSGAGRR